MSESATPASASAPRMADCAIASSVKSGKRPKSVMPTPVIMGCCMRSLLEGVVGCAVGQCEGHDTQGTANGRRLSIEQQAAERPHILGCEIDHRQPVRGLVLDVHDAVAVQKAGR